MNTMNASKAREKLYWLLDETAAAREPALITGPRSNGVLVGKKIGMLSRRLFIFSRFRAYVNSIREGLATSVDECEKEPGW
jgi:antitoxin YefM